MTTYNNVIYLQLNSDVDDKLNGLLNNMKQLKLIVSGGKNVLLELLDNSREVTLKKLSGSKLVKRAAYLKRFVVDA